MTIDLGEHFFTHDNECWLPIFGLPESKHFDGSAFAEIANQESTWFVGSVFLKNYFVVLDERPKIEQFQP